MGILDAILGQSGGLLGGAQPAAYKAPTNRPSFVERLTDLLSSDRFQGSMAGLASGDTWQDSLARSSVGYAAGKRNDSAKADEKARVAALNKALKAKSGLLSPEDMAALEADPELGRSYLAKIIAPKEYEQPATTADITNYQFAKQNGYAGTFQDFRNEGQGGGGSKYGLNPIWGVGPDGKPALVQLGENGQPVQPQMPEGFQISRDPVKMDAGTHWVLLDPQTRQVIGQVPKDVAGAQQQETIGKSQGEAQMALPAAQQTAAQVAQQVQALKSDPYLPSMVGPMDSRLPNVTADAARVQSKIDQLQGGAFLQARQMLKGGGAITDMEGQRAEAAMARLNQAQSEADFNAALDEFNAAVQQGVAKLQAIGGGRGQPPVPQQAPDGWQDLGGGVRIRQVQ